MIPVHIVLGIRRMQMKESSGGVEFKYDIYLMHYKNLYKCYKVPTPSTAIKKEKYCINYTRRRDK
jgi:hypothetical protein